MTSISSNGKVAYIYDQASQTWFPIAGTTNTAANYDWTGVHEFSSNPVTFNEVLYAQGGVNNFQNPNARDAAIPSAPDGLVCFIRQTNAGEQINQLQYYYSGVWKNLVGYSQISNRSKRGDLGSIFKLSSNSITKISQGHRNAQGILLYNGKDLLATEQGPRGGDELNLIKAGADYGWPFVSYGEPYGSDDYVKPTKPGTHIGYEEPIKYWVPSIAVTELVQLPKSGWAEWSNQLVLGTLKEQVLVFISLADNLTITDTQNFDIGERIRDLEVLNSGQLVATTDSGKLLILNLKE